MSAHIGLLWLGLLVAAQLLAAAARIPPTNRIRELARKWLVFNDGVGLSIGIYANGQRQFYNFGTTRLDGNKVPTENTVYEIGAIAKTMTGQLLARAIIEGRASLTDEVGKYLDEPYPNLENGGEPVRLVHLANMTSQLADNIPDLTQVRMVPGEPLATTRMRVLEKYTRAEFLRQLHLLKPRRSPGAEPAHSNVRQHAARRGAGEDLWRAVRDHPGARNRKAAEMGSGTAPPTKLLAQGYTKENEELPPFSAPMQFASGSLRYSTRGSAAVCVLAAGGTRRVGETRAPAHLAIPGPAPGCGVLLDHRRIAARPPPALFGRDLGIREHVRSLPGGGDRGRPAV